MILRLLTAVLLISALTGCKKGEANEMTELRDQVMAIHDEIMPEMSTMHKLKKELRKRNKDTENPILTAAITDLTKADDAMMDWMAAYKAPKTNNPEAIDYLNGQMTKITEVKKIMVMAIDNAKSLIDEQ